MFDLSAELTTKEILKRVGEMGKIPQASVNSGQPITGNSGNRSSAPVVARIETDPSPYHAESSVRHVGDGQSSNNEALAYPKPAYINPAGSTESHGSDRGSPNRQSQYRPGGPSQYPQRQNPVAPTGAG